MYKIDNAYRLRLFQAFVVFLLVALPLNAEFVFLPHSKLEPDENGALLRSSASEILYSYSFLESKSYECFNAGIKFPLLACLNSSQDNNQGWETEFGVLGGMYMRFELFTPSFNYIHGDFLLGAYGNLRVNSWLWGVTVYHISSQIGDDYIRVYDPLIADITDTGFEAAKIAGRYLGKWFSPTLGFEWKWASRPQGRYHDRVSLYPGFHASLLPLAVPLFFEAEAEIFSFMDAPNLGFRLGLYLEYFFNRILLQKRATGPTKEYHEFSVTYYYGYSKMGYFADQRESLLFVGPTFRF
jgi:hypothetical protein